MIMDQCEALESRIGRLSRVPLAHLPTPLEPMRRLGAGLGLDLWVKRDDCTGLALGGNKTRKLEFVLGDALAQGADTLVTWGGYQSNHVRQTIAAGRRYGLDCHCVLDVPAPDRRAHYFASGNLLLDRLFGAHIHLAPPDEPIEDVIEALVGTLRAASRRPYIVPLGASDAIGSVGYALAASELIAQCAAQGFEPGAVVLVTGSAGTHAGMLAGLKALKSKTRVIGVSSSEPAALKRARVKAILPPLLERLGSTCVIDEKDIAVHDDYVGEGYAIPTPAANEAIERLASTEGIILDPVYTGKGMAALIDLAGSGVFGKDEPVIFLHTGGSPALFVYDDQFWSGVPAS